MDAATKTALLALNFNADLITKLVGYGKFLNDANIKQETFKTTKSTYTETATKDLNEVYEKVMDVVVIAADTYKKDKVFAKQLSYAAVLATVKGPKPPKKTVKPSDPPPPTKGL